MNALEAYQRLQLVHRRQPWGKDFLQTAWGVLDRIPKLVELLIEERAARLFYQGMSTREPWETRAEFVKDRYRAEAQKELGL